MPMLSDQSPIAFSADLPERADVVVIGGGVAGVSAAYFLARRGVSTLLCEKGRIAGEQSSRNWGWIRQQGRDSDEVPLMVESLRLWEEIAASVDTNIGFARRGVLYLAETDAQLAERAKWLDVAEAHQLDTRLVTGPEVDAMIDGADGRWSGGLLTPSDAKAEPFVAVPALARAARSHGATIAENCAVRGLDIEAGRVSGVVTERGRVRADAVVVAGGAWSSLLLRRHGVRLPQLTVRATVARTAPTLNAYSGAAADAELAFRRRADGGYTLALCDYLEHFVSPDSFRQARAFLPALRAAWPELHVRVEGWRERFAEPSRWRDDEASPFERHRVLDPPPSPRALETIRRRAARRLPALAGAPIVEGWAGLIDATPDFVPVIDAAQRPRGLVIATGFSGHGFGIGPAAGRIAADLATGAAPGHDLNRFRLSRFSDGGALRPGPTL